MDAHYFPNRKHLDSILHHSGEAIRIIGRDTNFLFSLGLFYFGKVFEKRNEKQMN